ncbi:SpoIIE family protein phosphatase [uncultured Microscilla sp.]|uniref:SpoIIE family protein phosphatase n=1 Tax=uncultured Microscilla sp. TaxID=432653 RepID=UPI002616B7BB|nr:SpoIIE family protein phosphatase [uncultured Microscilla sp.]
MTHALATYTSLWLIAALLLLNIHLPFAQPTATSESLLTLNNPDFDDLDLAPYLQVLADPTHRLSFSDIKHQYNHQFTPLQSYQQPINSSYTYWVKLKVHNTSIRFIKGFLYLGVNDTTHVYVYDHQAAAFQDRQSTGVMIDFKDRLHGLGNWYDQLAEVRLTPQGLYTIYYKIHNHSSQAIDFQAKLVTDQSQQAHNKRQNFTQGVFHGFFWLIFFIAMTVFISTKEVVYLLFALQTISFSIGYLPSYGYLSFISNNNIHDYIIWLIASQLAGISYIQFMRVVLHTRQLSKYIDYALVLMIITRLMALFISGILLYQYKHAVATNMLSIINLANMVAGITIIVIVYNKGATFAKYLLVGSFLFLAGLTLNSVASLGLITDIEPGLFLQAGILWQNIMFGAGLGHNIYLNFKKEQEAQLKILSLEKNAKRELEQKVAERTQELKKANSEILTQNEELQQQQEEVLTQQDFIATKNKELARTNHKLDSSIRAANNIQQAILPHQSKFDQLLNDYFIIYQPKDVVSGDFYWINPIKTHPHQDTFPRPANPSVLSHTHKVVLAAVDCTGHGVPGAFMSLIGHMLLDRIVNILKITNPAKILTRLDNEVLNILTKNGVHSDGGMDMSIVVVEKLPDGQTQIDFAGAKSHLVYVDANDATLQEIKGSRRAIGREIKHPLGFENHRLTLPANSLLYLKSDGFTDQNNVKRRKFGTRRLKHTLAKIHHLPLLEQKVFLNTLLERYMRDTEQRDDILLIGVRL